jgi:hypothetical protein
MTMISNRPTAENPLEKRSPALEAKGQKLNRVRYDLQDRRRDSASRVSTNDAVDAVQNNKIEFLSIFIPAPEPRRADAGV